MQHESTQAAHATDLNRLAVSATNHCLTGCATGEVTGMVIAISLGWSDAAQVALAVGLAYIFGLSLTARPLVKARLGAGVVISTALAADTLSITIMEVIDNAFVVLIPGATEAGIDDPLIYASIAGGFLVAYPFTFVANRYMIARGRATRWCTSTTSQSTTPTEPAAASAVWPRPPDSLDAGCASLWIGPTTHPRFRRFGLAPGWL